jgi:hypothetical protein
LFCTIVNLPSLLRQHCWRRYPGDMGLALAQAMR